MIKTSLWRTIWQYIRWWPAAAKSLWYALTPIDQWSMPPVVWPYPTWRKERRDYWMASFRFYLNGHRRWVQDYNIQM